MRAKALSFFSAFKRLVNSLFKGKHYRPVVLRLGDEIRINPWILFGVLFGVSFLFKDVRGVSLTNSLGISYIIPYLIWFSRKTEGYLKRMRPSLKISEAEYQALLNQNGRYRTYRFLLISALAPMLVFLVNYNTPAAPSNAITHFQLLGLSLSKWYAIITGMLILQMNYITITEVFRFRRIEKKYAIVDLLDIHKLDVFSNMAMAAGMSLIGLYTVIPFSVWSEPEAINSLIASFAISVPILLINLLVPLSRVYQDISQRQEEEKVLIRHALEGDQESLSKLQIASKQPELTTMNLLDYRRYIEDLNPLPISQNKLVSFAGSIVLLILSWLAPYYYEKMILSFF